MATIKLKITRGRYTSVVSGHASVGSPDVIEIDMPVPDRADAYAGNAIRPADYVQLISTTFDKTAELVAVVRGDIVDADIAEDAEVQS